MKFGLRKQIAAGRSRNAISGCLAATFICLLLCCGGPVLLMSLLPEYGSTNQQSYTLPPAQRPQLTERPAAPDLGGPGYCFGSAVTDQSFKA